MFSVKRSAPAAAALAVVLTACGGTDGDVTTTDAGADAETPTTGRESPTLSPEPSPEPSAPDSDASPPPDESAEPRRAPTQPPDDGSDGTEPSPGTGGSRSAGEPATKLTVRLDPGNGDVAEWTVTCDPAGGTFGDPEAACETLDSMSPRAVAPVPPDQPCTMQFGGPETATITGRWDGTKVDLSFSKKNGCEIARWEAMEPILPAGDGALR